MMVYSLQNGLDGVAASKACSTQTTIQCLIRCKYIYMYGLNFGEPARVCVCVQSRWERC